MYPLGASGKLNRALATLAATKNLSVEQRLVEKLRILGEALAMGIEERRRVEHPQTTATPLQRADAAIDSMMVPASGTPFEEEVGVHIKHAEAQLATVRHLLSVKRYAGGFVGTVERVGDRVRAIVTHVVPTEEDARVAAEEFVWETPRFEEKDRYDWDEVDDLDTALRRIRHRDPITGLGRRVV